jgi:hypothetical protein
MRLVAAVLPLGALAACSSPAAEFARLWPAHRESIHLVIDGREQGAPLPWIAARRGYGDGTTTVDESFGWGDGGSVRWKLVASGVGASRELVVRVPTRSVDGRILVVGVNGAPLVPEFGAVESVVQLARDEATFVSIGVASDDGRTHGE